MAKNEVEIPFKSSFDRSGTDQAQDALKKTADDAAKVGEEAGKAGAGFEKLKDSVLGVVKNLMALGAVMAQLKEGYEDFATLNKAFGTMEAAAKRNGDNFKSIREETMKFAESLRETSAIAEEKSVPAIAKLYRQYGNMKDAQSAVLLAQGLMKSDSLTFEEALAAVHKASVGQTRALMDMGIVLEGNAGKSEKAEVLLKALAERTQGAAVNQNTLAFQTAKASADFAALREEIVRGLMQGYVPLVNTLRSLKEWFGFVTDATISLGTVVYNALIGPVKVLYTLVTDGPKQALAVARTVSQAIHDEADHILDAAKGTANRTAEIWEQSVKKVSVAVKAVPPPMKVLHVGKEEEQEIVNEWQRMVDHYHKLMGAMQDEMTERARKAEEKRVENELKIKLRGIKDTEKAYKDYDKELERLAANQTARILAEAQLKKKTRDAEKQAQGDFLDASMALGDTVFENNKEWSIASATISTFRAVAGQLAMEPVGPWNIALAAVMMANGLAQVAKIEATDVSTTGSGFDDPGNDAAARLGGRRWARDMIGEFTRGVSSGWREGMSGGAGTTTVNQQRTYNVHLHGAGLIDPNNVALAKQLQRTLDVVGRTVESQRTSARAGSR